MDCARTGNLIRALRARQGLTQRQLAERVGVSDRAVSKWENGRGAPDVTLLRALCDALNIKIEVLLDGELPEEDIVGGNMKKTRYFHCPVCGSLTLATGSATVSCCGHPLEAMTPQEPDEAHALRIDAVEDEWYLTATHPMARTHFITFAAFALPDRILLLKQYPEWDFQARIPKKRGLLLWHCNQDGLFSQRI